MELYLIVKGITSSVLLVFVDLKHLEVFLKHSIYYNHVHNILRLFDVLAIFPFTTSKAKHDS